VPMNPESDPRRAGLDRRAFLSGATIPFVAFAAALVGWPLVAFLFGPRRRPAAPRYADVPGLDRVGAGTPARLEFPYIHTDAYLSENLTHEVWVVRESTGALRVYSPTCPHLGCRYEWEAGRREFVCPCHGSVFTIDGTVVAGPAPRPLDTLPFRVRDGQLQVEWERFKVGIAEKVRV
jgi:menaquinol-cytochrome c reductase iron-sulfur subunit